MKTILLFITLFLTTIVWGQNPDYQSLDIQIQGHGPGWTHFGLFPGATTGFDSNYDLHPTFDWFLGTYSSYYDSTEASYQDLSYAEKYAVQVLPPSEYGQEDTLEYITNILIRETPTVEDYYINGWEFNLHEITGLAFRNSLSESWTLIDSTLQDTLTNNPEYFGIIYHYGDSLDVDSDGFVFCMQLKFITYPIPDTTVIDTIPTDTVITDTTALSIGMLSKREELGVRYTQQSIEFTAPNDSYNVSLYDMSGKLLFTRRYYGENFEVPVNNLNVGLYIYSLEGTEESYTGKVYISE